MTPAHPDATSAPATTAPRGAAGAAPSLPEGFGRRADLLLAGAPWPALAVVLYGAGNGLFTIARGAVPLALFGPGRYAALVGRLARPGLAAQALAPSLGAVALAYGGADAAYMLLLALALANVALVGALWNAR